MKHLALLALLASPLAPPLRSHAQSCIETVLVGDKTNLGTAFGSDAAIDGGRAAVGAPGYRFLGGSGLADGAVYVFQRQPGGSWDREDRVLPDVPGRTFGWGVALDGERLVILDLDPVARLFERQPGGTWTKTTSLVPDEPVPVPSALAMANGVVVVGYRGLNQSKGAAFVFEEVGGAWVQTGKLTSDAVPLASGLGRSVDTDGTTIVIAGSSFPAQGGMAIFERDGFGGWQEVRAFTGTGSEYGAAAAVDGHRLLVGRPLASNGGDFVAYERTDEGDWTLVGTFTSSMLAPGDRFGLPLTLDGDRALVGAIEHNGSSGAVFVFKEQEGAWSQLVRVLPPDPAPSDAFGYALGLDGDVAVVGNLTGAAYGEATILRRAGATLRNAGANPLTYATTTPRLGTSVSATVDNAAVGQTTSLLFAFDTAASVPLSGGRTVLALDLGGSGELFTGAGLTPTAAVAGVDQYAYLVPANAALCGLDLYSQAIQFGGGPFVLSNAQDLTLGGQ